MAFTTIPTSIISAGKAITAYLMGLIKDDLDDLDTRMTSIEGSAGKIVIFDEVIVNATSFSTLTGLAMYRAASDYNLTDCKIAIYTKGSLTGTLEIDIKVSSSTDFTSAVSVFTTKPSLVYSGISNYAESTNAAFDLTNKVITAGDYIRLDISSMPASGTLGKFNVYLIGEAS